LDQVVPQRLRKGAVKVAGQPLPTSVELWLANRRRTGVASFFRRVTRDGANELLDNRRIAVGGSKQNPPVSLLLLGGRLKLTVGVGIGEAFDLCGRERVRTACAPSHYFAIAKCRLTKFLKTSCHESLK
jgi:hypothetical protein